MPTGDETGNDERKYEHLEHAHEHVSGKRDEHDRLLGRLGDANDESDEEPEDDAENGQHEQQVLSQPSPRLTHNAQERQLSQ